MPQRHPTAHAGGYATVTVPNRGESVRLAANFLVQAARNMQVPTASDSLFEGAIVEALNNAVEHGNPSQRDDAVIVCELELVERQLTVRILDQGTGFVLRPLQPAWDAADIARIPEGGFGISIIQAVFPVIRTLAESDRSGLEMVLTF